LLQRSLAIEMLYAPLPFWDYDNGRSRCSASFGSKAIKHD